MTLFLFQSREDRVCSLVGAAGFSGFCKEKEMNLDTSSRREGSLHGLPLRPGARRPESAFPQSHRRLPSGDG
jgi:hypothetical protein